MAKWEYITYELELNESYERVLRTSKKEYAGWTRILEYMNILGERGWELVTASDLNYGGRIIFKRKKEK
jgi:hypothetical protein